MGRKSWRLGIGVPVILVLGYLGACGEVPTAPTGEDPVPICVEVDGIVYCY